MFLKLNSLRCQHRKCLVVAVAVDSEAVEVLGVDFGVVEVDSEAVEVGSEAVEDIVAEDVVVEDLLEELVLHVQLQDLEGGPIHMAIIDHIIDITDLGGIIIDHGIIDGGIPHIGRVVGIVLSIIALYIWVEGFYFSYCLH
jgi:hypothetical protein